MKNIGWIAALWLAGCAGGDLDPGYGSSTDTPSVRAEGEPHGEVTISSSLCAPDGRPASPALLHQQHLRFLEAQDSLSMENGFGPVETHTSNGEGEAGDGGTLTIGVHPFAQGLGVHAPSSLRFQVPPDCVRFTAQVGIDAEVGEKGSVVFQLYRDGALAYDSGAIRGSQTVRHADIAVSGGQELELRVLDAGDGNAHDHADWADALFVCPARPRAVGDVMAHLAPAFRQTSGIERALTQSDRAGAKALLAQHLRTRQVPVAEANATGPRPVPDPGFDTTRADLALEGTLPVSWSSAVVDVGTPPDFRSRNERTEGNAVLHRMAWVDALSEAYWYTGRAQYRDGFFTLLRAWRTQIPPPATTGRETAAYDALGVAARTPRLVRALLRFASTAPDEDVVFALQVIIEQAQLLADHRTVGNYGTEVHMALAHVGLLLPELEAARGYMLYGLCRLEEEARHDILEDGVHFELTPGYHMNIVTRFTAIERLAARNGVTMSEGFLDALERAYEAMVLLSRPNKRVPSINDTASTNYHRPWLAYAAQRFQRPDFKFVGTTTIDFAARALGGLTSAEHEAFHALPSQPPATTSYAFPRAGLVTMRSGWAQDSQYMLFDLGHEGGPHTHQAHMSVDVYARGRSFLVDPGCGDYEHPSVHYFKSPEAHNVLRIDGEARSSALKAHLWKTTPLLDVALGEVELAGHTWLRAAIFVKPDYWVILDTVIAGEDGAPDTIEQLWHFVPGTLDMATNQAVIAHPQPVAPRLTLQWPEGAQMALETQPGYLSQGVHGTAPLGDGGAAQADYLVASTPADGPLHLLPTLLLPQAAGDEGQAQFTAAEIPGGLLIETRRGQTQDLLVFAFAPPMEVYGIGTQEGWLGLYRIQDGALVEKSVLP